MRTALRKIGLRAAIVTGTLAVIGLVAAAELVWLRGELVVEEYFQSPSGASLEVPVERAGDAYTLEIHTLRTEALSWTLSDPHGRVVGSKSEVLGVDGTRLWTVRPEATGTHLLELESHSARSPSQTRVRILVGDRRVLGRLRNLSF